MYLQQMYEMGATDCAAATAEPVASAEFAAEPASAATPCAALRLLHISVAATTPLQKNMAS